MRIPFSNFVLISYLSLMATASFAEDAGFFARSQNIIERAEQSPMPAWLSRPPAKLDPAFENLLRRDEQGESRTGSQPEKKALSRDEGRWLFVSFSMPERELREALQYAQETQAVAVFRGIDGPDIPAFIKRVRKLAEGLEPIPSAIIDPLLYRQYGVDSVPTLVVGSGEGKFKSVSGLLSFDWLEKQPLGRHGNRGQVYSVLERDLIEEMQKRLATVDWQAQKERAIQGYWQRHGNFLDLPEADKETIRRFDPSIRVTSDIKLPNGSVLASKGDTLNPQQIMPLSKALVFFDATRPGQVSKVLEIGKAYQSKGKPVTYLASRLDTERGWDHLKELYERFDGPVYLLSKTVAERFHVERLPAVLEGEGDKLVIRELPPKSTEK